MVFRKLIRKSSLVYRLLFLLWACVVPRFYEKVVVVGFWSFSSERRVSEFVHDLSSVILLVLRPWLIVGSPLEDFRLSYRTDIYIIGSSANCDLWDEVVIVNGRSRQFLNEDLRISYWIRGLFGINL